MFALSPASFVTHEAILVSPEGLVISIIGAGQACAYAPVALPDGATVQSFLGWIRDPAVSQDAVVSLLRQPLGGAALTMASFQTSGTSALRLYADLSVGQPVIDNSLYSYSVQVCFFNGGVGDVELHGVYLIFEEGLA